jgi:hypothetical protein
MWLFYLVIASGDPAMESADIATPCQRHSQAYKACLRSVNRDGINGAEIVVDFAKVHCVLH